jgi:hypothetical protein
VPHLPVIPQVYRVTLLWVPHDGITVRNVLNVHDPTNFYNEAGIGASIGAQLGTVSHCFQCMPTAFSLPQCQVLALDGTSAGQTVTFSSTSGGGTGDTIPQASGVLKFHTGLRGQRNRGRLYIGPVSEGSQAAGLLDSTIQSNMTTAWSTVWSNLASLTAPIIMGVASYKGAVFHALDVGPQMEGKLGTQRRRMQQLRRFG